MAEARLTAVVETKGAKRANDELGKLAKNSKKVEGNVIKAEKRFKSFGKNAGAAIAAVDGPLGGISSRVSSLTTILTSGTAAITLFAGAFVAAGAIIIQGVARLDEYDVNLRRVNATIKATGEGVGFTGLQLREEAEALALATLTSVDAVQKAQAKLLTFNRVLGDEFTRSIRLAQDLAETGFGSVESNAILLGKALQDPIKGMAALSRVGVTLSESQKQLAQDAVNAGDVFAAQGIILDAVAGQVDGVAAAVASGTLAGATDSLSQNWDDMTRAIAKSTGALGIWESVVNRTSATAGLIAASLGERDYKSFTDEITRVSAALNDLTTRSREFEEIGNNFAVTGLEVKIKSLREELVKLNADGQSVFEEERKRQVDVTKKEAEARKRITAEVKAEADEKSAREKTKADEKLNRQKVSAQRELETILNLNNSELEAIKTKEDKRLAVITSSRESELITEANFQLAKTEIELSAAQSRKDISDKEEKDRADKIDKRLSLEDSARSERQGIFDKTESDLESALGKENKLFKSAAITNTTIKTYEAATSAYASLASIPIVGPALGAVAAAAAVAAGLANVQKITSAREQGGSLSAGQSSSIAERGQLEILTPSSSSRIRTKQQMQQLMGGDGGNSAPVINVVNIDQSSRGVDIETTTDDDGRIINLIRDTTALDAANPNSDLRKTLGATTNLEARR